MNTPTHKELSHVNPNLTDIIELDEVDADGALRETADAIPGATRGEMLRKAGAAGGTLLLGGALMGSLPVGALAKSKGLPKSDIAILNFALTLEYLEAAFYKEAASSGALSGPTQSFAELVARHEATHVTTLKKVLGSKAVKKPTFDFKGTTMDQGKFQQTAFTLENTGVHAYLGQAGKIKTPAILGAAATIVTVEARHAAAIAEIIKSDPKGRNGITPDGAFDVPFSKAKILKAVKATGFITG
jgi:rubrerythrin